jgi:DNA-binding protein HU-beta
VVPVFRAGTGFKTLLPQAGGVSMSPGSAAVEGGVPKAKGKKLQAAASGFPAGTVAVADAAADGRKKAGEKARDQAGEKGSKSARKAARNKAGKKAAKGLGRP